MCIKFSITERLAAAQTHYLVHTNSEYVVFGSENSVIRVTMWTATLNHLVMCFLHVFAKNAVNWSPRLR
jgi:hypothetical protein